MGWALRRVEERSKGEDDEGLVDCILKGELSAERLEESYLHCLLQPYDIWVLAWKCPQFLDIHAATLLKRSCLFNVMCLKLHLY